MTRLWGLWEQELRVAFIFNHAHGHHLRMLKAIVGLSHGMLGQEVEGRHLISNLRHVSCAAEIRLTDHDSFGEGLLEEHLLLLLDRWRDIRSTDIALRALQYRMALGKICISPFMKGQALLGVLMMLLIASCVLDRVGHAIDPVLLVLYPTRSYHCVVLLLHLVFVVDGADVGAGHRRLLLSYRLSLGEEHGFS